jgi:hypothetical protein
MNIPARLLAVALVLAGPAAPVVAQPARPAPTPPASADPTRAQAPVPALAYRSALQNYRPWREQAPGDWRALNDEVTRIGGWRSYLREVHQAPATPADATPKPTPALATPATVSPTPRSEAAPRPAAEPIPPRKGHSHGHH